METIEINAYNEERVKITLSNVDIVKFSDGMLGKKSFLRFPRSFKYHKGHDTATFLLYVSILIYINYANRISEERGPPLFYFFPTVLQKNSFIYNAQMGMLILKNE